MIIHKKLVMDNKKEIVSINDFLEANGLEEYEQLFETEKIDLDMLLDLKEEEFNEMVQAIGIVPWGHIHKLIKAIYLLKINISLEQHKIC